MRWGWERRGGERKGGVWYSVSEGLGSFSIGKRITSFSLSGIIIEAIDEERKKRRRGSEERKAVVVNDPDDDGSAASAETMVGNPSVLPYRNRCGVYRGYWKAVHVLSPFMLRVCLQQVLYVLCDCK